MTALSLIATLALAPQAPAPDFAQAWTQVESAISQRYYARTSRKEDMDRLFAKYAPLAKSAKTTAEFGDAINRMIDDFGDSHFGFFTPADQTYYMMAALQTPQSPLQMPHIGAWFRRTGDGYTVQMVTEGSQAAQADIRKGDLVLTIDGQPFAPVAPLQERVNQDVKLRVRRGASTLEKAVRVRKDAGSRIFLDGTRNSVRSIERGGKKYGYIHLWTMSSEDYKNALSGAVYGSLKDTDGFILDVRDGFGGRPEGYADPFFRPEVTLEWKIGAGGFEQLFGYQRPLILLINKGSRSAKEVLAYILKKSGRAILVGETTGGNVLGTFPQRLSDWGILEIPMVEVLVDGIRLEKVGVSPHIPLPREFDDSGRDLYIEEAVKVLSQQAAKKAA